jgi:hypothetical protein
MPRHKWLVYYKQRRPGQSYWGEANAVTSETPGEFLLRLKKEFPSQESILMWAIPVDADTAKALSGIL